MLKSIGEHRVNGKLKVCICGGGSLSHCMAAVLGARQWIETRILTRRPHEWSRQIRLLYLDKFELHGQIDSVSDCPEEVITGSDMVLIAVPHFARKAMLSRIKPYLSESTWVGGIPGYGGFLWTAGEILGKHRSLFGLQRVPYVRKVVNYGKCVRVSGIRPRLYIGTVPAEYGSNICNWINAMFNIPSTPLNSYLAVCLSNSNPIFHPSRIYALWKDHEPDRVYQDRPEFYSDWDDESSEIYLKCDSELQMICNALPMDLSDNIDIKKHFSISNVSEMTHTIRNIKALSGRLMPMCKIQDGWRPDINTYYFQEDIPYGLLVQKSIAQLVNVKTTTIDSVISWGQDWLGKKWLCDGRLIGSNTGGLPIPQNLQLNNVNALVQWLTPA